MIYGTSTRIEGCGMMDWNARFGDDSFIAELAENLHVHGYKAFYGEHYSEHDMERYRKQLFPIFQNVMWVEVDSSKKYLIVDYRGRNTVIKLINGMLNTRRTLKANQAMSGINKPETQQEITQLMRLVHLLQFATFRT